MPQRTTYATGKGGLVDLGKNPNLAGIRHQVVPLVSKRPPAR
jgi:hypothetical protein